MLSVSLGPLALSLSHVLLLGSLACAVLMGWWLARRSGRNPEAELFSLLLVGLVVARGAFVLGYWAHFSAQPWRVLDIRDGGFIVWPGLLAALGVGAWLAWRDPALRRPLLGGLASGVLIWGASAWVVTSLNRGTAVPSVSLRDMQGQSVVVADLLGKPLVINIWATWCPPCRREMPILEKAQAERPDVQFVFVNQGESEHSVRQFLEQQGLQLDNVLFDSSGRFSQQLGSTALPTTVFYSAEGRQLGSHLGELSSASLAHAIKQLEVDETP